jgi:hypothetical protein
MGYSRSRWSPVEGEGKWIRASAVYGNKQPEDLLRAVRGTLEDHSERRCRVRPRLQFGGREEDRKTGLLLPV